VISLLFHRLFTPEELKADIYRHEQVSVEQFEAVVRFFAERGYEFITASALLEAKRSGNRCVMITFDDGYHDNLRVLPILERYDARATLFLAPAPIVEQSVFWPDAAHAAGYGNAMKALIDLAPTALSEQLRKANPNAFKPTPLTRPLSREELDRLLASGRIELGHHSYHHLSLTKRSDAAIDEEIDRSNAFFNDVLGHEPRSIAYPNGNYSKQVIRRCHARGIDVGLTCNAQADSLPAMPQPKQLMRLGRFMIAGNRPIPAQLASAVSRKSIKQAIYKTRQALRWPKGL
jgi:peptidoglycan/xylan/chitin deacetylase (PgdA/CDA1 family)